MFLNLFILLLSLSGSPAKKDTLLDWNSNRRLTWDDFKAQPDGSSVNAALTSTNINIDFSYNNRDFKYKLRCSFDPNKSWGRVKTEYILGHEQAHFDIAEIHARILNKELKNYKFNQRSASKDIGEIYNKVMRMHHEMQEKYDDETNYSRNEKKQADWSEFIGKTLTDLQAHSNYK